MKPGGSPHVVGSERGGWPTSAGWCLVAVLAISAVGCSPVERVQRDDPKRRLSLGMLVGDAEDTDPGNPDIQSFRMKYVGGTEARDGAEDGWAPAFYGESEYWSADRSSGLRDATLYDVCVGLRSVDVLSGSIASRQRFRLPCELGTNWSQLQIPGSQGAQWDFIPILSYRLAVEPELLLVITSNSELSLFANAGITGGVVVVQNGEDNTGWQSSLSVGARYFYRKLAMELAYTHRRVEVSSTLTDDMNSQVSGEDVTFSGAFLSFGLSF